MPADAAMYSEVVVTETNDGRARQPRLTPAAGWPRPPATTLTTTTTTTHDHNHTTTTPTPTTEHH